MRKGYRGRCGVKKKNDEDGCDAKGGKILKDFVGGEKNGKDFLG